MPYVSVFRSPHLVSTRLTHFFRSKQICGVGNFDAELAAHTHEFYVTHLLTLLRMAATPSGSGSEPLRPGAATLRMLVTVTSAQLRLPTTAQLGAAVSALTAALLCGVILQPAAAIDAELLGAVCGGEPLLAPVAAGTRLCLRYPVLPVDSSHFSFSAAALEASYGLCSPLVAAHHPLLTALLAGLPAPATLQHAPAHLALGRLLAVCTPHVHGVERARLLVDHGASRSWTPATAPPNASPLPPRAVVRWMLRAAPSASCFAAGGAAQTQLAVKVCRRVA